MAHMKYASFVLAAMLAAATAAHAAEPMKADNTGMNKRDRNGAGITAQQQSSAKSDRETTRMIRRSVIADKALSTSAHNVKIITRAGEVTLKGPVKSEAERKAVLVRAHSAIPGARIIDQMSIAR